MTVLALGLLLFAASLDQDDRAVGLGEGGLRRSAIMAPTPEYPRASIATKAAGVAVAEVIFGADGKTRTVDVLEAPDAHIAEAVRTAVAKWTWRPVTISGRPEQHAGRGKLTFYFRVVNGQGRVTSPAFKPAPKRTGAPGAAPSVVVHGSSAVEMTDDDLSRRQGAVVLDIGERAAFKRGHRPGAINVPYDEIGVRAPHELDPKKLHVIDCTRDQRPICNIAHDMLKESGFARLAILVRR